MNIKKSTASAVFAFAAVSAFAAVPEVSSVVMTQASDSRLVTITYTLGEAPGVITLDVQTNATANAATDDPGWASIGGKAVWNATGDVWKKVETGSHTISWRPDLSWPDHKITDGRARAVVTAWALDNTPDYMAVDISATGGEGAQRYYPAADFVPGGVTNSLYKTTMLLMRKIMAKDVTWTMGSTPSETQRASGLVEMAHQVTLTNNYYIGVYQVTQDQWGTVTSGNPSYFNNVNDRAMRPVEQVTFVNIRSSTSLWPNPPGSGSFLGNLNAKTRLDFDLPSEAQWEFAARAGNGSTKRGDGSAILNTSPDANLNRFGRYSKNGGYVDGTIEPDQSCGATNGTAIVGSYAPSNWGLYDTLGNVWELCLDYYQEDITAYGGKTNIDPSDPSKPLSGTATLVVKRGGAWYSGAGHCRPAFRTAASKIGGDKNTGFRVVCTAGLQ